MQENIAVSVVVPVYNAAAHLEKCVGSILGQTLRNFELILVDDGSTDESAAICDSFLKDERVKVIHKKNSGPGEARNSGIEAARGEFIGFADADDRVSPEMFKKLYESAVQNGSDLVFCDYIAETKNGNINVQSDFSGNRTYNKEEIQNAMLPYFFGYGDGELYNYKSFCPFADYSSYVWLGLYRASVIKNNRLRFPNQSTYYNEDHLFNLNFTYYASKITHVAKFFYYYRDCDESLTKKYNEGFLNAKLNRYLYLRKFIDGNNCDEAFHKRLDNKICIESIHIINYYVNTVSISSKEKHKKICETVNTPEISGALKSLNLKSMPFSKLSLFLWLEKIKACRILLLLSRAYSLIR
jgi:glycosyltransferase involved in cell wall biosynthesis